jgi:hypothetical protein
VSEPTLAAPRTFSYGATPAWAGSYRHCAQSLRTTNVALADRPLVCPVAVTLWEPGSAEAGTPNGAFEKEPLALLTAEPTTVWSKESSIGSDGAKLMPRAVVWVVGGPLATPSRTRARAAGPAAATAGIEPASASAIESRTATRATPRLIDRPRCPPRSRHGSLRVRDRTW